MFLAEAEHENMASLRTIVQCYRVIPLFRPLNSQFASELHRKTRPPRSSSQGTKCDFVSGPLISRLLSTCSGTQRKNLHHYERRSTVMLSTSHSLLKYDFPVVFFRPCRFATTYRSNNRPRPDRPKAQTTIDEEEISKFSALANLWWDETGEFEALHSMNSLRVPFIRDALKDKMVTNKDYNSIMPLQGLKILDIGSGGGILSEPLARLGATMIGVDASEENVRTAQAHLLQDPSIICKVKYIHSTVEDIAATEENKFDALVASEIIEHVSDVDVFVEHCCKLVKPGGSLFFTTINKTPMSYVLGVLVAERVLRLVAPGTHDWKKFISPDDLMFLTENHGFSTRLLHGMKYNPFNKQWSWTSDTSINYALHFVKNEE